MTETTSNWSALFPGLTLQPFTFQSIRLDAQGNVVDRVVGQAWKYVEAGCPALHFDLVALPGGTFQMGSPRGQGYEDETPRHLVSLKPFLLARTPVTQALWQVVTGRAAHGRFQGADLPVENLTWLEAREFCQKLGRQTGRAYRLPSEAEWECACRAGLSNPFSTGETITTSYANYVGAHTYRDEAPGEYRHVTTPVELFLPNAFGISDLHGNVWEYCADRWHSDYTGAPFDGSAWEWSGEAGYRVTRGGSWHEPPINLRCATRLRVNEKERDDYYGFRIALSAE
jgi:formylglycine-generating enzyme required for sulfatase activity